VPNSSYCQISPTARDSTTADNPNPMPDLADSNKTCDVQANIVGRHFRPQNRLRTWRAFLSVRMLVCHVSPSVATLTLTLTLNLRQIWHCEEYGTAPDHRVDAAGLRLGRSSPMSPSVKRRSHRNAMQRDRTQRKTSHASRGTGSCVWVPRARRRALSCVAHSGPLPSGAKNAP